MASVVHPNLATIYGAETWQGTPMLVVEFLEAGTLAERVSASRLTAPEAVSLGLLLADVLARIHGAGILHRDVKPSNIGYTADGVAKLLDFGVARIVEESRSSAGSAEASETQATLPGEDGDPSKFTADGIVGTPFYMSPEALRGEPPDASFDLWGVTVALFEALTGRHPFDRGTWAATYRAIGREDPNDLREADATASASLAEFFRDALSADLWKRPGTAQQLEERLAAVSV